MDPRLRDCSTYLENQLHTLHWDVREEAFQSSPLEDRTRPRCHIQARHTIPGAPKMHAEKREVSARAASLFEELTSASRPRGRKGAFKMTPADRKKVVRHPTCRAVFSVPVFGYLA